MTSLIQILLIAALIIQIAYHVMVYGRFAFSGPKVNATIRKITPVSVVICAKNEAGNLRRNLPLILEQAYPDFEVVVVNDRSTDDTAKILAEFSKKHQHLRIVSVKKQDARLKGKRNALLTGISKARHEQLILTDTDCQPTSKYWIQNMAWQLNDRTEIVLGFSPYERRPGFLNRLIRFETFQTGMQYLSFAHIGLPYMGVGRNLAYNKSLFMDSERFQNQEQLISGDDDLFVNEHANASNTCIVVNDATMMVSQPKTDWRSWLRQKRRHMAAGIRYKFIHLLLLGGYQASQAVFYIALIAGFLLGVDPRLLGGLFLLRLVVQLTVYLPAMKKLKSADLWFMTPALDFVYTVYYFILSPLSVLKPIQSWK